MKVPWRDTELFDCEGDVAGHIVDGKVELNDDFIWALYLADQLLDPEEPRQVHLYFRDHRPLELVDIKFTVDLT